MQPQPLLPNPFLSCLFASSILLRVLLSFLVELLPITLKLLRNCRLQRIIRNRLGQQLLGCGKDTHDFARWLPRICLQDANTHAALVVEGNIGVVDSGLKVYDGWLEGVFGWEDEEELEFATLGEERY